MGKKINKKDKITELSILFILLIVSFFLWDTYFIYPVKLFVVMLHEISHAIVTFISGGKIISMNIGSDLSGKCEAEGGIPILIAVAGYLGSLFWGLLFFISPNNKKIGKWIIISICAIVIIATIAFSTSNLFLLSALGLSILLIAAAFYLKIPIVTILVRTFGMISCVYVLFDIKEDIFSKAYFISDASILSNLTNIPMILIGLIWIIISLLGIILAIRQSYMK